MLSVQTLKHGCKYLSLGWGWRGVPLRSLMKDHVINLINHIPDVGSVVGWIVGKHLVLLFLWLQTPPERYPAIRNDGARLMMPPNGSDPWWLGVAVASVMNPWLTTEHTRRSQVHREDSATGSVAIDREVGSGSQALFQALVTGCWVTGAQGAQLTHIHGSPWWRPVAVVDAIFATQTPSIISHQPLVHSL